MLPTRALRQAAAAQHRTPMIKFIGKRYPPASIDHTPQSHPASPTESLPDSFKSYRAKAQQHGPLGRPMAQIVVGGHIGGHSGGSLGAVEPPKGQYFDRSELPARFQKTPWTQAEIDAVDTAGASLFA